MTIPDSHPLQRLRHATEKVTALQAGYMELKGAKKDGSCNIVNVPGGVSLEKGCCNLYRPKTDADEFRCGECIHAGGKA